MRNTAAQSGYCEYCGEVIFRHHPRQKWQADKDHGFWEAAHCIHPDSPEHKHKLAVRTPIVDKKVI